MAETYWRQRAKLQSHVPASRLLTCHTETICLTPDSSGCAGRHHQHKVEYLKTFTHEHSSCPTTTWSMFRTPSSLTLHHNRVVFPIIHHGRASSQRRAFPRHISPLIPISPIDNRTQGESHDGHPHKRVLRAGKDAKNQDQNQEAATEEQQRPQGGSKRRRPNAVELMRP